MEETYPLLFDTRNTFAVSKDAVLAIQSGHVK
jgi:hypothetical protein